MKLDKLIFYGKIADKVFRLNNAEGFKEKIARYDDCPKVIMTIEKTKSIRTLQQNSYLWGVIYGVIAKETNNAVNDIHEFCKKKFLPKRFIKLGKMEEEVAPSTTRLKKLEFMDYISNITAFFSTEFYISFPDYEMYKESLWKK